MSLNNPKTPMERLTRRLEDKNCEVVHLQNEIARKDHQIEQLQIAFDDATKQIAQNILRIEELNKYSRSDILDVE